MRRLLLLGLLLAVSLAPLPGCGGGHETHPMPQTKRGAIPKPGGVP